MRHRKSGRKLNRSDSHRRAMFRNMARSLITHERIRTTEAKAKELRGVVDKLITLALRDDLHSRRLAYKTLGSHQLVQRLFDEVAPRFTGGTGGYTRIIKMSMPRAGDCAPMVLIELTRLAGEEAPAAKEPKAVKAEPTAPVAEAPAAPVAEAPAEEAPEAEAADEEAPKAE